MVKFQFKHGTTAIVLLVICGLGFGLFIPMLGFFWDDWPAITTLRLLGVNGFWDFYRGERPLSAWTFLVFGPLFGTNPLAWHVFTLVMRWLTILTMWWMLQLLWPTRKNEATWMAFLFAIYPIFTQQPVAVAFSQHWITFALYFFSMASMLVAVRKPRWHLPFTALSLLTAALHMLTMEYFIGLELLRPIFLWLVYSHEDMDTSRRMRRVLINWLPYLLLLSGVVIWRLFFMEIISEDPNNPVLLYGLFTQPLPAIIQLVQLGVQEFLEDLIGVWQLALPANIVDFSNKLFLTSLVVGIISAGLTSFYLLNLKPDPDLGPTEGRSWHRQAIGVGFLAAFLGSITVWVTNRSVLTGLQGGRFGLAAMFGISMLVVGLLSWLTPRRIQKVAIMAVLVGVAVAFHYRMTAGYFNAWVKQNQFYWQLSWRAPYLKPGSVLYSTDELFLYVGRNPTAMALNLLYPQPGDSPALAYWFVELPYHVGPKGIPDLLKGRPLNFSFRNYSYSGSSLAGLAIYYEPEAGRCLWVLSPRDRYNPDIPPLTEEVLPISNLSRISASDEAADSPPTEIFGKEPYHSWCYYFQKAELARQMADWQQVVDLADTAAAAGYKPANPHERQPFIEAYAHIGDWEKAFQQTRKAYEKDERYAQQLCYLWKQITQDLQVPGDASQRLDEMLEQLQCQTLS
jgi:hypothetical protein